MTINRVILTVLTFFCLTAIPLSAQESSFTATDCLFESNNYNVTCGFVSVPENHLVENGETIQLAVAVIHTNNPNPELDPVLYLAGGPGAANVQMAWKFATMIGFRTLLANRDVIIVDQRGMGLSQPTFNCIPFSTVEDAFNLSIEEYQRRMQDCIPRYEEAGIDWQAYTTEQNAADLAMIPSALGYGAYNIFGQSYGTTLGQIILRDYPETVRSAVLDSVIPLNADVFTETAINHAEIFAQLEAQCHENWLCQWAYPNLSDTYISTYERLQTNPTRITGDGYDVTVDGRLFADFVNLNMANTAGARMLPAIITAFATDDLGIITDFLQTIANTSAENYPNQALLMTMICPSSAPYTTPEAIQDAQQTIPEPFRIVGLNETTWQLCQSWNGVPPASLALAESDIPTLLLAGEFDPLAPPHWAEQAATNLSNATVISVPNAGHIVNSTGCGQGIIADFINDPHATVETDCLDSTDPLRFVLHTTVTRPPIRLIAIVLAFIGALGIALTLFNGLRDIQRTAWRMAFKKQGWLPLISLVVTVLLVWGNSSLLPSELVSVGVVQSIMPLLIAIQLSIVFSPSDEPALEVQLAAERSILWLVVERIVVVLLTYTVIAFAGIALTLVLDTEQTTAILWLGWLPSSLFLGGLAMYLTIRSRVIAFGALTAGLLWFVFGLFATYFMPGQLLPSPIDIIQPFMWSIHVHASLNDLTLADYWLNRLFLSGAGLSLLMMGVYELRDIETLLLGVRSKSSRRGKISEKIITQDKKAVLTIEPVKTKIVRWHQALGIGKYTFLMRMRSRGLKVFALTPIAVFIVFIIAMSDVSFAPGMEGVENLPVEQLNNIVGKMIAAISASILIVPVTILFPILAADTVPDDKHLRVDEILSATPVSYWTGLIGRAIGTTLAGTITIIVVMTIIVGMAVARYGAFTIAPFVDLILGMSFALTLLTILAVIIGATQPSGRRAVALVFVLMVLPEFFQQIDFLATLFPSRLDYFLQYFGSETFLEIPSKTSWTAFSKTTLDYLLGVLGQIVAFGLMGWFIHLYQKNIN